MPHVAWAFPTAPRQPVTLNGGAVMTAWFDIYGLTPEDRADTAGFDNARNHVETKIAGLMKRHPAIRRDRIVVAGFSQGAVISLWSLLRGSSTLAGVVAISGWLPDHQRLIEYLDEPSVEFKRRLVPILMCHGTKDQLVQFRWAKAGAKKMKDAGMNITWKTYPVEHTTSDKEMDDIVLFLKQLLPRDRAERQEL